MKHINLLIKPASSLCNLRCKYCFYQDEAQNRSEASMGMLSRENTELLLRGVGDTVASMRGGLIQLAVKVAAIAVGAWAFHSLTLIWTAWPLSFAAAGLYLFLHYRKSDIERKEAL